MYCKNCGQFLSGKENFCSNCGSKIIVEEVKKENNGSDSKVEDIGFVKSVEEPVKEVNNKGIKLPEMNWNTDEFSRSKKTETTVISWRNDDMFLQKELKEAETVSSFPKSEEYRSEDDQSTSDEEEKRQEEKQNDVKVPRDTKSNLEIPKVFRDAQEQERKPDFLKDEHVVEVEQPSVSRAIEVENGKETVIFDGKERIVSEKIDETTDFIKTAEFPTDFKKAVLEPTIGQEEPAQEIEKIPSLDSAETLKTLETAEVVAKEEPKSLFDEIALEAMSSLENTQIDEDKKRIDKFYTFNKKKEEFQRLLDKEYERIEKNVESGGLEDDISKFMDVELGTDVDATSQLEEMVRARQLFFDNPIDYGQGQDKNVDYISKEDKKEENQNFVENEAENNVTLGDEVGTESKFDDEILLDETDEVVANENEKEIAGSDGENIDEHLEEVLKEEQAKDNKENKDEDASFNEGISRDILENKEDDHDEDEKKDRVILIDSFEGEIDGESKEEKDGVEFLYGDDDSISITSPVSNQSESKENKVSESKSEEKEKVNIVNPVASDGKEEKAHEESGDNSKHSESAQVIIEPEEGEKLSNDKVAEKFFSEEDYDKSKMGKGSKAVLYILGIITILIVALFAVRVLMPKSYVARQIDNVSSKIVSVFKGDTETKTDEKEGDLAIDKTELIKANMDKDANKTLDSVTFNGELKYSANDKTAFDNISDAKITSGLTWKSENGEDITYDKAIVGKLIEFESAKNNYILNGNKEVFDLLEKDSELYKSIETLRANKTDKIKKVEIGDIRKSGNDFFLWISEGTDKEVVKKIYKVTLDGDKFVFVAESKL